MFCRMCGLIFKKSIENIFCIDIIIVRINYEFRKRFISVKRILNNWFQLGKTEETTNRVTLCLLKFILGGEIYVSKFRCIFYDKRLLE